MWVFLYLTEMVLSFLLNQKSISVEIDQMLTWASACQTFVSFDENDQDGQDVYNCLKVRATRLQPPFQNPSRQMSDVFIDWQHP